MEGCKREECKEWSGWSEIGCKKDGRCCENCDHLNYSPAQSDQPYPEIICNKDIFDGVDSPKDLLELTDCKEWVLRKEP